MKFKKSNITFFFYFKTPETFNFFLLFTLDSRVMEGQPCGAVTATTAEGTRVTSHTAEAFTEQDYSVILMHIS